MNQNLTTVGWREWVSLPMLRLPWIAAKIDMSKTTSVLHTFSTETFEKDELKMVRYCIHPYQHNNDVTVLCESPIISTRETHDTFGKKETHYFVETMMHIGDDKHSIILELVNRNHASSLLLLGHTIIDGRYIIDPSKSYQLKSPSKEELSSLYNHKNENN